MHRVREATAAMARHRRALLMLLLAGLVWSWPQLASPWLFPHYQYMHERFTGVRVDDAAGRFLGVFPGPMDPVGDFSTGFPSPDHKALYLPPDAVPEGWWRVLTALEDRHLGSWRSWGGIDVVSLGKALFWDLPRGRFRGASTLPMMLVRSMRHAAADPDESWGGKLGRKLLEWLHAPVLMHELGGGDHRRLRQWLAMHVPLVQGAPGSRLGAPMYGLEASARVLFGVSATELDLAQQAILAAAFYRPILLGPEPGALQARYWRRITGRAAHGLVAAYGDAAAAAVRRVRSMPLPAPHIDPGLRSALPDDPVRRFRVLANPAVRARWFAGPALIQTSAELQDRFGYAWRRRVGAVQLTLDAAADRLFRSGIERLLAERFAQQAARSQVIVALADRQGRLVRYFATGEDSVYAGIRARRDENGRYLAGRETRPVGSLGKVPLALFLAARGAAADEPWCDRGIAFAGQPLHNPGGGAGVSSCRGPGAWYPAWQAYARSLNLPLLWRLGREPDGDLAPYLDAFRLRPPADTPLRSALTFGTAAAAPRNLHRMVHLTAAALRGERAAVAEITVVARAWVRRGEGLTPTADTVPVPLPAPLAAVSARPAARESAVRLLAAPLEPGGTAGRLADWAATRHPSVSLHIAKTGTTQGSDGATRDAYLAGALVLDANPWSYLALIGSGHPADPLSGRIGGGSTAPLVRAALESVAGIPPGGKLAAVGRAADGPAH